MRLLPQYRQWVLEKLKEEEGTKRIPVIMCTAKSGKHEVVKALERGVRDYIVKPFAGAILLQKVKAVLEAETHEEVPS